MSGKGVKKLKNMIWGSKMLGDLYTKINKDYGFIFGEDKKEYFLHRSQLQKCNWDDLEEGTKLLFTPVCQDGKNKAIKAEVYLSIPQIEVPEPNMVVPGLHPMVKLESFSDEEKEIVITLSKTFYVTNGGADVHLGTTSEYRYCLIKPTNDFSVLFNLYREIIVVFSPYEHFEPRTFDAISVVYKRNTQNFRIDKICSVIISKDPKIETEIKDILKNDVEMQVIVPFSYEELRGGDKSITFINRFKRHFFERDLFAFESPLKKDIFFFGRRNYVHELISRHNSGENSGVFGLRRSGKSSVLQAINRASSLIDTSCVLLDCQDIYHFRWNKALFYVSKAISDALDRSTLINEDHYSEENASNQFSIDIAQYLKTTGSILLMFDEVEQITPGLSLNDYWKNGDDFIMFWHAIRSNFHKWGNKFTFILAGTNPSAIEIITINKHDNPLFNQLKADSYLPPFSVDDTKEMVNKLGGYMGLIFDDIVCAQLTQDFGGHPYLIRHFCSVINDYLINNGLKKPATITTALYNKVMPIFTEKYADNYCKFILSVLVDYYPEENTYLENLALGNTLTENVDPQLLDHLTGYGIIENNQGVKDLKIDILKQYILRKKAYYRQNMTEKEKWAEISERRNAIEPKLRSIVKNQLKAVYGNGAKQKVLDNMRSDLKTKYSSLNYNDLFEPKKCEIYFKQLGDLINKHWDPCFKNIFSKSKQCINAYFVTINDLRCECHAKPITDDEMNSFRGSISRLEKEVDEYFN